MPPPPFDALGIARAWLREPHRTHATPGLTYAPGADRLARICLAPLLAVVLEPLPLATVEDRARQLLDSAEPALREDLQNAHLDVDQLLDSVAAELAPFPVKRALPSGDIQDRVAAALRDLMLPAWQASTDARGAPAGAFAPVWREAPRSLQVDLTETARLRRAKIWARGAGADDELTFTRAWIGAIHSAVTAANPAGQSPSSVALGLGDRHFPRIADDPPVPTNWRVATDRSFYSRVQLHWDGSHLPRELGSADPPGRTPDERFGSDPQPGHALIRESIARTVTPLGLSEPVHRLLIQEVLIAVQSAASDPRTRTNAAELAAVWHRVLQADLPPARRDELMRSLWDYAAVRLARKRVAPHALDEYQFSRCVGRRFWMRLHAWEVVGSRIPPPELLRDLGLCLDQSLGAAGVLADGSHPIRLDESRTENTIRVIEEIQSDHVAAGRLIDGPDAPPRPPLGPDEVLAEYGRRYSRIVRNRTTQKNGGLRPPRWVERKLEFRGEDL